MGSPAPRFVVATLTTALLVAGLVLAASAGSWAPAPAPAPTPAPNLAAQGVAGAAGTSPNEREGVRRALGALHSWDLRRERAWSDGDADALASLYVRGSSAARSDLRLLGSYAARGLVVRRTLTQVLAVELLRRGPEMMRLRVLDRVAGGEVVTREGSLTLGTTPPSVHTIVLRRVGGSWLVESVSASGSGPRAAPPPRQGR
ncbi:MAG: hypothetical protein ABIN79_11685 [Marmoricola sp.]